MIESVNTRNLRRLDFLISSKIFPLANLPSTCSKEDIFHAITEHALLRITDVAEDVQLYVSL